MIKLADLRGHWALVTGASGGIGAAFALELARSGVNVVLVGRRAERLQELATRVVHELGVKAEVVRVDLAQPGAVELVKQQLAQAGIRIRLLCNIAGMGRWNRLEHWELNDYREMLEVNNRAVVEMCYHFLPDLASYPSSAVINVSSQASYQPVPYMAVYAASKAFVQSFSQALHGEWKERGILVQTLVPGPTDTEFDAKAGAYSSALTTRGTTAEVVKASLAGLAKGDPVVASIKGTYKQRFFAGLFPHSMVIREVAKMFKPPP
ncbi:SDR family NAD(P)-dependent oxidoreductase [Pseudoduganella sp. DS3]|uniref:SDR family NAD(P)-dependent oxidoreductase n=1 Tax=Pseudoduganella guangdongensis TaxID=2692179 RepID=A0A6N9HNA5_9BURK|nr:SDR family oxidoreductase [Pseudoduganella guangdongensis]MYN05211.1 SDR family NAD(P)-dependent oxidoreductase [Pseudoduganella guangdongensis]